MKMNYQDALELAQSRVEKYYKQPMWLAGVIAKPYGWVFFFETLEYFESGDSKQQMDGNVPVIVFKSGEVSDVPGGWSAPRFLAEWEKYTATGASPLIEHLIKRGSKLPQAAPES